ncbi:MAG: hypothetical protein DWQ04_30485 [Chloroflexi bacterium]|nr:MAG: hypothetical protein DWQ04_30485 [Chloroflexota bacterium]
MLSVFHTHKRRYLQIAILAIPLILYLFLRFLPNIDIKNWPVTWDTYLIEFYVGSFASLVSLVAAIFTSNSLGDESHPRTMFIPIAFVNISVMLLISSIGTPQIIASPTYADIYFWSLRFAYPLGSVFFFLGHLPWHKLISKNLTKFRRIFWSLGAIFILCYSIIVVINPASFSSLHQYSPLLENLLALVAISLLCSAAWYSWRLEWNAYPYINKRISIVLLLLAEAQFFQAFGDLGGYNWLLYHPVTLSAFMIAVSAILSTYESEQNIQFTRYFATLGIVLIGAIALIFGEFTARLLDLELQRTYVIPIILIQGALSFLILFVIVMYLNRLITERTEALKREQRLRTELTQLIVHDLKSPLTVITSGMNLMSKGNLGEISETQQRLLNKLEKSGKHIISLINDLLDVERLEANQLEMQPSHTNITKILKYCVDENQIVAGTHHQTLSLTSPTLLPSVRVDKRLLQRVFNNLISNALKFTPEEGKIEINVLVDIDRMMIQFADNGPGVPAEDREYIFEKFGQAKGTERRGAGLGLTFCKMVIEAHDGTLVVKESRWGGALFEMSLPIPQQIASDSLSSSELADADLKFETF